MSRRRILRYAVAAVLLVLAGVSATLAWQAGELRRFRQVLLTCEIASPACGEEMRDWLGRKTTRLSTGWRFDAETYDLVARAHAVSARQATELPARRAALKQALVASERAIALRPRWGYAHAARLGILVQLGDLDAVSDAAWRDAWRFGPNEKRVLRAIAEAHAAYREAGRAPPVDPAPALTRLARRDRPFLVALAVRQGDRDMLCGPSGVLPADPVCQAGPSR